MTEFVSKNALIVRASLTEYTEHPLLVIVGLTVLSELLNSNEWNEAMNDNVKLPDVYTGKWMLRSEEADDTSYDG